MKNFKILIPVLLLVAGVFMTGCNNSSDKTDATNKDANTETTENKTEDNMSGGEMTMVNVPSVQCNSCKKTITGALKETDGVKEVDVDVKGKTVKVMYDKSKTDLSKIEATIVGAGYDANDKKADKDAYAKLDDCCKLPEDQKEKGMH
jgi:copper chaperone CopZ